MTAGDTTEEAGLPDDAPLLPEEAAKEQEHQRVVHRVRRISRDAVLFLVGLAIIVNEAFIQTEPSQPLLYLAAGLVGLPTFLRLDEAAKKK